MNRRMWTRLDEFEGPSTPADIPGFVSNACSASRRARIPSPVSQCQTYGFYDAKPAWGAVVELRAARTARLRGCTGASTIVFSAHCVADRKIMIANLRPRGRLVDRCRIRRLGLLTQSRPALILFQTWCMPLTAGSWIGRARWFITQPVLVSSLAGMGYASSRALYT